jgi:dihydropteroate synthase
MTQVNLTTNLSAIDNELSKRHINLDPGGYFIIYLDRAEGLICAKHYNNLVDEQGFALHPVTGERLSAKCNDSDQVPTTIYTGRTAKELCVKLFEETEPCPVTQFNHAAYLGRELMRAEIALIQGSEYIQD